MTFYRLNTDTLSVIRTSLGHFFFEIVSHLCFEQSSVPEGTLITMLLDIVFTKQVHKRKEKRLKEGKTEEIIHLDPYKDLCDKHPIIRPFLQLLFQNKYE